MACLPVLLLCSRTTMWKSRDSLPPSLPLPSLHKCCRVSFPFSPSFSLTSCVGCIAQGSLQFFLFQLVCKLPIKLRRLGWELSCGSWVQTRKPYLSVSRNPQPSPGFLSSLPSPSYLLDGGRIDGLFRGEVGLLQPPSTQPPCLLQLWMNRARRSHRYVFLVPFVLPWY